MIYRDVKTGKQYHKGTSRRERRTLIKRRKGRRRSEGNEQSGVG